MRQLLPWLLVFLLSACGMKGDLYEVPLPEPVEPGLEPAASDTDKGGRKTIPATPDPATAR